LETLQPPSSNMISDPAPSSHGVLRTILYRMARSARLDGKMFRSLKEDTKANRQSILVLGIAGLLFGIGTAFSLGVDLYGVLVVAGLGAVATILIGFIWLTLTYLVGTRILGGTSSYWGLARPFFFSFSPAPLLLLMLIPTWPVPQLALSVAVAWISVASVIAVKNSLGIDSQRSLIAFILVALLIIFLYGLLQSVVSFSL
jgi:Yip1 domain